MSSEDLLLEYSATLGRISARQFQAMLDRFGLGRFMRAETVGGGAFGQALYLTSKTGEYVLRGAPDWPYTPASVAAFSARHPELLLSWLPCGHDIGREMPDVLARVIASFASLVQPG